MDIYNEISEACAIVNVDCALLSKTDSIQFINETFSKYKVHKKAGHLSIGYDVEKLRTEKYELSYSDYLDDEPVYLFFDQENDDQNKVVYIGSSKKLSFILGECNGFEYFLSNFSRSWLICVNWYVVEGIGDYVKKIFKELQLNDPTI
jgi:hypothetical protein